MKFSIYIFLVFSILVLIYKCSPESEELNNSDLIFHNSFQLKVYPYSYVGEFDKSYLCKGDTIYYTLIPDTFDSKPLIKWDSLKFNILTVAIFNSPIIVKNNSVNNIDNIIWQWNSGMNNDNKYGIVKYNEGKHVLNSIIDYETEPIPLETGLYYWAVWGWNPEGTKILYSTRQMSFYVQ